MARLASGSFAGRDLPPLETEKSVEINPYLEISK